MKSLPEIFEEWLPGDEVRVFGQILIERTERDFVARHVDDGEMGLETLEELSEINAIREMTKYCPSGEYRPLKTSPTLRKGWLIRSASIADFYTKIDAIYPAALAGTIKYFQGELSPTPLRKTLDRQTGMYRFAGSITDAHANKIMRETCAKGCVRRIAWPIDTSCEVGKVTFSGKRIPIVCNEACTFVVSEARRLAREAYDRANAPKD